jgi:hypothetical protein
MKKVHYHRNFLNNEEHGGTAFVEASIEEAHDTSKGHFEAMLSIADCSRVVSLDFCVYSAEQADQARAKIARLRRAVVAFEKVLLAQLDGVKE